MSKQAALRGISQALGTLNQAREMAKDERFRKKLSALESRVQELDEQFLAAISSSNSKAFRRICEQLRVVQMELDELSRK